MLINSFSDICFAGHFEIPAFEYCFLNFLKLSEFDADWK